MQKDNIESRYLTVKQLSVYLQRSEGAIRNLVLRKKIPYRKPAGRILFNRIEINVWIKNSPGISVEEIFDE